MAENKTIWQILEEYGKDLKYAEINIKVTFHDGRGVAFEETQPPVRKFKESQFNK